MKQANPADYITKARSTPDVEYVGSWDVMGFDMFADQKFAHYLRLHAGRSILERACQHIDNAQGSTYAWVFLDRIRLEIEREIEEVKRG